MENGDDWLALDKLEHFLFCFFISIFISTLLLNQTRHPFLRRWSIWFGTLASIAAGVAKEVGDEIGLWNSAGASTKDLIADLTGTLIASICLHFYKSFFASKRKSAEEVMPIRGIQMV